MATPTNTTVAGAAPPTTLSGRKRPCSSLVPLRVDVTSEKASIRIVDTLLFDPHCWPIPLDSKSNGRNDDDDINSGLEANAQELAHGILSDAEVIGMGRTVRHFTGRVDLWSWDLQQRVANQLRPQLQELLNSPDRVPPSVVGGIKKGKQSAAITSSSNAAASKTIAKTLKRIRLRLNVNAVDIVDDFLWDMTSYDTCPIDFSYQLAKDLKLGDEATVAIATSILEQLYGVEVPIQAGVGDCNQAAATITEIREHTNNMAHMVGLHRPVRPKE